MQFVDLPSNLPLLLIDRQQEQERYDEQSYSQQDGDRLHCNRSLEGDKVQHAVHMHYNSKISNFNARCIIL